MIDPKALVAELKVALSNQEIHWREFKERPIRGHDKHYLCPDSEQHILNVIAALEASNDKVEISNVLKAKLDDMACQHYPFLSANWTYECVLLSLVLELIMEDEQKK